jgi:hypothetical protein
MMLGIQFLSMVMLKGCSEGTIAASRSDCLTHSNMQLS